MIRVADYIKIRPVGRILVVLLMSLVFTACAGMKLQPNPSNPIKRVAILPIKNNTNDVEAPNFVRGKLAEAMGRRFYNIKPMEDVDQILRDQMGITLGGQLDIAETDKLKELLDVEGLVFGTLMNYEDITTGLINIRKVRATFNMTNTLTGEEFWANGIGVKTEETSGGLLGSIAALGTTLADNKADDGVKWVKLQSQGGGGSIWEGLAKGLAKKAFAKMTKTHLVYETTEMARMITATLPIGPGLPAGQ